MLAFHPTFRVFLLAVSTTAFALAAEPAPGRQGGRTVLVEPGPDGSLRYQPYLTTGDTLRGFSHCGYGGGGVPLPDAPVREALQPEPGNGDDASRIQNPLPARPPLKIQCPCSGPPRRAGRSNTKKTSRIRSP